VITLFNRRELIITRSMEKQAQVRNMLADENVDYIVRTSGAHGRGVPGRRAYTGSFGQNAEFDREYRIFVKKEDYDKAKYLINR